MPRTHHKGRNSTTRSTGQKVVYIKGKIETRYYFMSEETLEELEKCSDTTNKFDLSLFFFALACGIIVTLLTAEFRSIAVLTVLVSVASISLVVGVFKYFSHLNNEGRINSIIKKIRKRNRAG